MSRKSTKSTSSRQSAPLSVIVCAEIGDPMSQEGQKIRKSFGNIIGSSLPVKAPPSDLSAIAETLTKKFPWADDAVSLVLGEIAQKQTYGDARLSGVLKPFLLVGSPGCGKTKFATELSHIMGLPADILTGAATDTAGLQAVSRGWSTALPSGPVNAMHRHLCANPVLIIDEIDKAKAVNNNGHIWSTLLSMLNGDGNYYDSCLMANVDLRYVNFWATANDITSMPEPLLDRFTIVDIPAPTGQFADRILDSVIEEHLESIGAVTAPELTDLDRHKMTKVLNSKNGSIRQMQLAYRAWLRDQALKDALPAYRNMPNFSAELVRLPTINGHQH